VGIEDLPADKRREVDVGRAFIPALNAARGTRFQLDETYWDREKDPFSPDLRFGIAGRTGLSRVRVTQIVNLTLLAPEIQDQVLLYSPFRLSEGVARQLTSVTDWTSQQPSGKSRLASFGR
jgi:hypothetical protein